MLSEAEKRALSAGDVLRLKKPHPCGAYEWTVLRVGADFRLRCNGCQRMVTLPRAEVERRTVKVADHVELDF